jgi:UDP-N-acetylglucosamine 2-epimerase (non-hydrolysing)
MKIALILGTRPEIIKLAPIIIELEKRRIDFFIIHTNQHYDYKLDQVFFKELHLLQPKYNLKINSKTSSNMIGKMLIKLEEVILKENPEIIVVQGDTNSTLAGALIASKCGIKLIHIEAGARSYDRNMPEEVNRVITDALSNTLIAITNKEKINLLKEGIADNKIYVVGNTTPDSLALIDRVVTKNILKKFELDQRKYIIITLHRPSNVDQKKSLEEIFSLLQEAKEKYLSDFDFIWPIHPRTVKNINKFKLKIPLFIKVIEPVGYPDMISLVKNSRIIFTDSGGVLEEAYLLKKPCITLRDTIELKFTVESKLNFLVNRNKKLLEEALNYHLNIKKYNWKYPYAQNVSKKIVEIFLKR